MKASELIQELAKFIADHGDLLVVSYDRRAEEYVEVECTNTGINKFQTAAMEDAESMTLEID